MGELVSSITENVEDLYLEIYVVGYWKQGESILFILKSTLPEEKILYSGMIDSYKKSNVNYSLELFKDLVGVNSKLDFFCWTHPDKDHSVDVDTVLEQFCDIDTRIVIPPSLTNNKSRLTKYGKKISTSLLELNRGRADDDLYDFCYATTGKLVKRICIGENRLSPKYSIEIVALSPYTPIIEKQATKSKIYHNEYSISLLIQCGKFKVLLASDIEDDSIKAIKREYPAIPTTYNFIKIPHHGSDSSLELFEYLDENIKSDIACTTTFNARKLPKKEVIQKYKAYAKKVYCTSKKANFGYRYIEKWRDEIEDYHIQNNNNGIVKTQFNLTNIDDVKCDDAICDGDGCKEIGYKVIRHNSAVRLK